MYYNTNSLTGSEYIQERNRAKSQDEKLHLYLIYSKNRVKEFTASYIWKYSGLFDEAPITSPRRSINTLKKKGIIEDTGRKQKGLYGSKESIYRLKVL